MRKLTYLSFGIVFILFISCGDDDNNKGGTVAPQGDPVTSFNSNLQLPAGSYTVDPDTMEIDETIDIEGPAPGSAAMPIYPNQQMEGKITFSAPSGNVVGAGMRFGTSGPVNVVPVNVPSGSTSGTLNVPFQVTDATCANLSQVCHDIKCYEFAVTSDGKISKANIRDVALMCGNCDEPSCKDLIDPPCPAAPGEGNFSIDGITYVADLVLCGLDPQGSGKEIIIFQKTLSNSEIAYAYLYNIQDGTQSLSKYADTDFDVLNDPYILSANTSGTFTRATVSGSVTRSGNSVTFNCTTFDILDENYSGTVAGNGTCTQ
ncbi:hypothetical protein HZR84_03505 [Hyphobacterium sp. CCMP332]|nr:hypothetical protein HZR84_03505 [Hyphobacterium sp. CCMP332]